MNVGSPLKIEDYGLIGDCTTAALVGRNASIDWLCWPRFDSAACFAALLGDGDHGRWSIGPVEPDRFRTSRSYRGHTLVLETIFEAGENSFAVIDFMPIDAPASSIVRIVEGRRGSIAVRMELTLRFDHGSAVRGLGGLRTSLFVLLRVLIWLSCERRSSWRASISQRCRSSP